jgi:hypothetical protein
MKTRTHFAHRIDMWDDDGENLIEHLAGLEDLQVALATFLAACQRWPGIPITLRQGARVIEDSRRLPAHQPGTVWEYSMAVDLLGRVVEAASFSPFNGF